MNIRSPYDGLQMSKELACEFFAVFSRFEFALKAGGYYSIKNQRVWPDWKNYSKHAAGLFTDMDPRMSEIIQLLVEKPPQIQSSANGWAHVSLKGDSPTEKAIDAVQRVRNNLFHGGKYLPNESERDENLVKASRDLLLMCLKRDAELRRVYESF